MSAASSYKRLKPQAEAIVLERDSHFIRIAVFYYVTDGHQSLINISLTPKMATDQGIDVRTRHEVSDMNVEKEAGSLEGS